MLKNGILKWAVAFFCTVCCAYSLIVRFTNFFMASRMEKMILAGSALAGSGIISLIIYLGLFNGSTNLKPKSMLKIISASALVATALLIFVIPPLYFPENHLLEIKPISSAEDGSLTIVSIQRIEMPGGETESVHPSQMDFQGSWQVDPVSDNITLRSVPETKLSFAQLMQAGIGVTFKTGPQQSQARILWGDEEIVLDLFAPIESTQYLELMPALDLPRADLTRKILVGPALIAEFLGLCAILTSSLLLFKFSTLRNAKILLACAAGLLILLPVVYIANPPVQFQDPQLEAAVREILEQPDGLISSHNVLTIVKLDISYRNIASLEGIQKLRKLESLNLRENVLIDITPLSKLTRLRKLDLRGNSIKDITPLAPLTNLEILDLRDNDIQGLAPLHRMAQLHELDLRGNSVSDINPIEPLINLEVVNLQDNLISDISPLSQLMLLRELNLRGNSVRDITALRLLTKLDTLDLRENSVVDLFPLSSLERLHDLNLRDNSVSSITPLTNLIKIESLNLRGNPVSNIAPLIQMKKLTDLNLSGIYLGDDISFLRSFPNLVRLDLRNCDISNISLLAELMDQGALQDDQSDDIHALVDIRDNPIPTDASDGYSSLRPFWENISERGPFTLPQNYILEAPVFSQTGGFYEKDFLLTISTQDPLAEIHYTLDGSEPDQNSPLFDQPLQIQSNIGEINILSAINSISPQWKEPLSEVFKATVVRAKVMRPDGSQSRTMTQTFFVDPDIGKRYGLPIISLTTDPDYFFDDDQGIYIMGRYWDEDNDDVGDRWEIHPANYSQSGGRWERPINVEFFDASGAKLMTQEVGVRIHGQWSSSYRQKSLRLIADDWYDQSDHFNYEFFPGLQDPVKGEPINDFKFLLLRNSGGDWDITLFRDAMMQSLVKPATTIDTQAYRPVVAFLNGEYWGIYNLRERLDEHYLTAHYQVDPENVVILENSGILKVGESGDETHYQDLLDYIRSHEIADPQVYSYVATQMDIENFIDYQIAEIFFRNTDWPGNNIRFWRYKTDGYHPEAPYGQDGRWRWMLFDTDAGFGIRKEVLEAYKHNTLKYAISPNESGGFLLRSLLENAEFRTQFINRSADLLNTTFTTQRVTSIIDEMQAKIAPEMPEHIQRWRTMEDSMDVWQQNVDRMSTFARERPEYMRQHIADTFKLSGSAAITLITDTAKGHIRINSVDITEDTPGVMDGDNWSGFYFKGIPIDISAIPEPGFIFAGWEGVDQSAPDIQLVAENDLILTANFVSIED